MATSSTPRTRFNQQSFRSTAPSRSFTRKRTVATPQTPSTHFHLYQVPVGTPPDPSRIGFSSGAQWHAVFYVGQTVTLYPANHGATNYEIYDYRDNLVSTGPMDGQPFDGISPTPTAGGVFGPGYYRVLWYGPVWDYQFHYSYGSMMFSVIRNTPGFQPMPTFATDPIRQTASDTGGEFRDVVVKGVMGMGTSRGQITHAEFVDPTNIYAPDSSAATSGNTDNVYSVQLNAQWIHDWQPADPVRPWQAMMEFPSATVDCFVVGNYGNVYCKDATIDGSKVFVGSGPGSTTGSKITVSFPNASTLVETWDNIPDGPTADSRINNPTTGSHYIFFVYYNNGPAQTQAPTAIGSQYRNGVINAVNYLYPLGNTRFEGPSNEPGLSDRDSIKKANMFVETVHQGNPAAKAIGPPAVSNNLQYLSAWDAFFAGGGDMDEISTHMYSTGLDHNEGRIHYDRWFDVLKKYGQQDKPVWCTESTQASCLGWSRPAGSPLRETLLLEQYGLPRERNQYWYDVSHGFWSVPVFFEPEDGTLGPQAVLYRVLAEETWGQTHHHAIDFGSVQGNQTFLGSIYENPDDGSQTAVVVSPSGGGPAGYTVTFGIAGTIPTSFNYCDGLGVASVISTVSGKVTMPVEDFPGYLHIPSGTHLYVDHCLDWPTVPNPSISQYARCSYSGTQPATNIGDNQLLSFFQFYTGLSASQKVLYNNQPDTAEMFWNDTVNVDSVVVFAGPAVYAYCTLADFDVQTTADGGTTWTTRATHTNTDLNSLYHPMSFVGTGNYYEIHWDPQFIFNVNLGGTFAVNGIRLKVRATSYGGYPTIDMARFGLGYPQRDMQISLQEIVVPSTSTPSAFTDGYADLVLAEANVVGFWRFNDTWTGSGTVAVSQVNPTTVNGTYTVGNGTGDNVSAVNGPLADGVAASSLNGGTTLFSTPNVPGNPLDIGDHFTVEFWRGGRPGSGTNGTFMGWYSNHTQVSLGFNGDKLHLDNVAISSVGPPDSGWHHWAVTKNGTATHIYLDGQDVTTLLVNTTYSTGGFTEFTMTPGTGAGVQVADLAVYTTDLSASDIKDHYYASALVTAVPATNPLFFAPEPTITGTASVGEQLQASSGHWTNFPTQYTYQWQTSVNGTTGWTNISGATRSDFIVTSGDFGLFLRVVVTASNIAGAGTAQNSDIIGPVGGSSAGIANLTAPVVSGVAESGFVLTCSTGTWTGSPTTFAFQWQVSSTGTGGWTDISGAIASTFLVPPSDIALFLRCGVSAS